MSGQAWFQKKPKIAAPDPAEPSTVSSSRMEGIWEKCDECGDIMLAEELTKALNVCPSCGHHMALPARARLASLCDPDSFEEFDTKLESTDPLGFADSKKYKDRIKSTMKALGENDAFISGVGTIEGRRVSIGTFNFDYMGGSMGSVVGEKVTRVFERAFDLKCPAIVFSASGGARMQEGIFSLMQMAKTSAAINRFREIRQPYISVLLHPTTGGVAASFSWLGDVILAEPRALIGFAGPRVIEQTIRQKLPEGFQRSEFLLEHGMIDAIVQRKDLRGKVAQLLGLMAS
ncbi:MAG: acetyl-CoA carboxylase carboxyl transferase subunit beta [Archangium gephyra]|uniref:Acetyl-coenzyme A carboxylase carboxyl transferase subunit beta n=1 Tax=Archangium gephyra TaxID=48 RepID=A0A2W5UMC3_9BACT|nr:MAG: acetyl-CoA carboxylase carboxyl transferase subunit beta [Archangium gephyra]